MSTQMYITEIFEMEWACNIPRESRKRSRDDAMNYVALNCLEEWGFPINEDHFGEDVGYPEINAWRLPPYPPINVAEHIGETHPVSIQSFETPEDWRHFHHMRQRIPAIQGLILNLQLRMMKRSKTLDFLTSFHLHI